MCRLVFCSYVDNTCMTTSYHQEERFFTEVPVPSQESKRSRVCVLVVPMLPLKMI